MAKPEKYALVTGASSGIGWHISLELAERGYHIIGVSNQPEKLELLKSVIGKSYEKECFTLNTDLAVPGAANLVFTLCEEQKVIPEVLVNNAGMLLLGELITRDENKLRQILNLHINTLTELAYLSAKQMKANGVGYILNVSSISAVMQVPVISVYGPTKTYVRAFTRALRIEMAEYNVRVSCLIPGATNTPLNDSLGSKAEFLFNPKLMMQPESVAKKAINGLFKNKAEVVPGILNKITLFVFPLIPTWVIRLLYQTKLGRKLK